MSMEKIDFSQNFLSAIVKMKDLPRSFAVDGWRTDVYTLKLSRQYGSSDLHHRSLQEMDLLAP